jgi:hypothetical protein
LWIRLIGDKDKMAFKDLKRRKGLDELTKEIESYSSKKQEDDRFWKVTRDKSGNGSALIRFLPAPDGETFPWVRMFSHAFKGPSGQWYIEKSLTTLKQNDPVSEYNSQLWQNGEEDQARKQKRRLHYVSNILVLKDPGNPENEGKVFLFKYGKKIFDKIKDQMEPEPDGLEDKEPVIPFDLWEGADFKLRVRMVDKFPNYDKSEFSRPEALFEGDDEKLEELWNKEYKLQELIAPSEFKSYDQLKSRLETVLCLSSNAPVQNSAPKAEAAAQSISEPEAEIEETPSTNESDDELETLLQLASED